MLLPQSSLLGGSTRFLVVPNIPNFRPHTHARILTYLGDDPPAYCRQAYSTLSRLGPALPPNNGEANRQLGKRQEALSSSLRSVLRAALLIASLASSLLSCIKLLLLMFLFGWLFLMTTRSILRSGSRHCGWSHNLLLLSVAPCFIAIIHLMLFLSWWHILSGPIWTFDLVSFMKTLNKQCSDSTSLMWRERNFEELWTIFRSKKKPLLQSIRSKVPDQRCQSRIPPPIHPLWGYFQISIQISSRERLCQSRTQSPRRRSWTRGSTPKLSKNCEYHPLYCQTVGEISSDQIRSPWLIFIPKTI